MSTCPELFDLHAFVDGELPIDERRRIDAHSRACIDCRRVLASLSRVEGVLFARPELPLREGYEIRFKARLLDRMTVRQEPSRRHASIVVSAVAAGFLLVWVAAFASHRFDGADRSAREPTSIERAEIVGAASAEARRAAELDRLLAAAESRADDLRALLVDFDQRLASDGARRLAPRLADRLATRPVAEEAVLCAMRAHRDPSYTAVLRDRIDDPSELDAGQRLRRTLAQVDGRAIMPVLERDLARGARLSDALALVLEAGGSQQSERVLAWVRRAMSAVDFDETSIDLIGRLHGPTVDRLLLDLWLDGSQSSVLAEHLARRPNVLADLRSLAFDRNAEAMRRKLAIDLVARFGDIDSVPHLDRMIVKRDLAEEAVAALCRIGGEDVWTRLPRHLYLARSPRSDSLQREIETGLARLGDPAARFFLDKVKRGGPFDRHYLTAAALAASPELLPAFAEFVERDELKNDILEIVVEVGGERARPLLERWTADGDASLRRAARHLLDRLRKKSRDTKGRWRGLVRATSPMIAPDAERPFESAPKDCERLA